MRTIILFLLAGFLLAQAPGFQPVGSVSQVMISITYPTSDAIFLCRAEFAQDREGLE